MLKLKIENSILFFEFFLSFIIIFGFRCDVTCNCHKLSHIIHCHMSHDHVPQKDIEGSGIIISTYILTVYNIYSL